MECLEWHQVLLQQFGTLVLPRMEGGQYVRGVLNAGAAQCSRTGDNRLAVADIGWQADQGSLAREKSGPNPTDRAKGSVKRSLLTDGSSIPLAAVIDSANRHDMKLARTTLDALKVENPSLLAVWPQGLCIDKGHDYPEIWRLAVEPGYRLHIRSCGE